MAYTVYLTLQNDYILETEDYYEKTLVYDEVIEASKLGQSLFENVEWQISEDKNVRMLLPMEIDSARCLLIHPVDSKFDRIVPTSVRANEILLDFASGEPLDIRWRLELTAFIKGKPALIQKRWNY